MVWCTISARGIIGTYFLEARISLGRAIKNDSLIFLSQASGLPSILDVSTGWGPSSFYSSRASLFKSKARKLLDWQGWSSCMTTTFSGPDPLRLLSLGLFEKSSIHQPPFYCCRDEHKTSGYYRFYNRRNSSKCRKTRNSVYAYSCAKT